MNETDTIYCNEEEKTRRISFCISCDKNNLDVIPKCSECDCSISILTTLNFKVCPIGKW